MPMSAEAVSRGLVTFRQVLVVVLVCMCVGCMSHLELVNIVMNGCPVRSKKRVIRVGTLRLL